MSNQRTGWTNHREDKLRKLWASGYTASQCAAVIEGGFSRNAIIGKVHRLKLQKRGRTPAKRGPDKHLRQRPKRFPVEGAVILPPVFKPIPERLKADAWSPLEGSRPLTIMEVDDHTCRWPVGEGRPFLFCGQHIETGVYCEAHAALSRGRGTTDEKYAVKTAIAAVKRENAYGFRGAMRGVIA